MPLSVFAALELRPGPDSSGVWLNGSTAVAQVERSLLTAQDYRLSEEAGYQMQTIIQMAPSKATYTSVYELPQTVDAFVQM